MSVKNKSTITRMEDHWADEDGNKCCFDYFNSEDAALAAIQSLEGCDNCINCSGCYDCSGCSGCSGCYDCSDCSDCSCCYNCSRCSDSSGCYGKDGIKEGLKNEWNVKIKAPASSVLRALEAEGCSLKMDKWHTCGTVHCFAGWLVTLAGEDGKALERETSTEFAAMRIYYNSTGQSINPSWFYLNDKDGLEKIKELAAKEPKE